MTRLCLLLLGSLSLACTSTGPAREEMARWEGRAKAVTITRDDWGIPHIRGTTDADAVFGMIYAQAEDDFNRVEMNYLNAMGRVAEALGEAEVYRDLRMRLIVDPDSMKALYASSAPWLRSLMDAWADGLNYYLATHPQTIPKVLKRFEPWMALTFSEGSIGWDIETVSVSELEAFYGKGPAKVAVAEPRGPEVEPGGSNGIAIAPSRTASGAALLLINPHTSFFFRAEMQVTSDEGLNAYGAVTWGQFFVYQGFNERAGWMHTSSGVDAIDEYAETVAEKKDRVYYRYGGEERPLATSRITVRYQTEAGMAEKAFTVYRSHHGPIVRKADGKWISVKLMQEPVKALTESYSRTKATGYDAFKATVDLETNSSNNTVYADREGNIAYFEASFIPKRDTSFDWRRPVDGSNPATEWQGLHSVEEHPNLKNPPNGWIQNTNNSPWSAAGANSPKAKDFPSYVDRAGENQRGIHAIRVLANRTGFTLDSLMAAAYDSYLPAFDDLLPPLIVAYDKASSASPLKGQLSEQIAMLKSWNRRWSAASVPTALAVSWGQELAQAVRADVELEQMSIYQYMATKATFAQRLEALAAASAKLSADFGTWKTPWGDINRFQRLTDDLVHPFNDDSASIPVGFTSSQWGSLASFGARPYNGSKKIYGTNGNSFVAVVEFGDSVRARAVTAGGQSGDPKSRHFNDQALRYSTGALRTVYFYPSQLKGHTERAYRPGQ